MSSRVRATFLIVAVATMLNLNLSFLKMFIVIVGYYVATDVDQWLTRRARIKAVEEVIEDETSEWETDPDDRTQEIKGDFERIKLGDKEQLVVGRIAQILRRIEHAKFEEALWIIGELQSAS